MVLNIGQACRSPVFKIRFGFSREKGTNTALSREHVSGRYE
jgi:hypothetical protein